MLALSGLNPVNRRVYSCNFLTTAVYPTEESSSIYFSLGVVWVHRVPPPNTADLFILVGFLGLGTIRRATGWVTQDTRLGRGLKGTDLTTLYTLCLTDGNKIPGPYSDPGNC